MAEVIPIISQISAVVKTAKAIHDVVQDVKSFEAKSKTLDRYISVLVQPVEQLEKQCSEEELERYRDSSGDTGTGDATDAASATCNLDENGVRIWISSLAKLRQCMEEIHTFLRELSNKSGITKMWQNKKISDKFDSYTHSVLVYGQSLTVSLQVDFKKLFTPDMNIQLNKMFSAIMIMENNVADLKQESEIQGKYLAEMATELRFLKELNSPSENVGQSKPNPIPEKAEPADADALRRLIEEITEKSRDAGGAAVVNSDEEDMVKAAAAGNLEEVKEFLKQDPELANARFNEMTPLQVASHQGHLPIVQLLVDDHASLEQKDSEGDTALVYAVIGNHPSVADFLLNRKAYVNTANKSRQTPLHISAHHGHKSCVEVLIKHGGSVNMQDDDGNLPIHAAIACKSTSLVDISVDIFIDHPQADLKMRNNDGFTPLHYAAKKDCLEVVKKLVAKDPSLASIQEENGFIPLDVAAANNYADIVRFLINTPNCDFSTRISHLGSFSTLHLATLKGCTEVVELLVDHGADVNVRVKGGDSVLHIAAMRRMSGQNYVQDTPTMRKICEEIRDPAITSAADAFMAYLIRHGSDVTIKNDNGQTPFDLLKKEPVLRTALMKVAGIPV